VRPAGGLTSHGTRDRKYIRIVIVLVAAIVVLAPGVPFPLCVIQTFAADAETSGAKQSVSKTNTQLDRHLEKCFKFSSLVLTESLHCRVAEAFRASQ